MKYYNIFLFTKRGKKKTDQMRVIKWEKVWNDNRERERERRERQRDREKWYLLKLWAKSLRREKLMWLQSQRKHNCQHLQREITTMVFLLVPFLKEKWNYKLFVSNGLNKFQIWMIGDFYFLFLNSFFFVE